MENKRPHFRLFILDAKIVMKNSLKFSMKILTAGLFAFAIVPQVANSDQTMTGKSKGSEAVGLTVNEQPRTNQFWWPDQLNLSQLRDHDGRSNPCLLYTSPSPRD